MNITCYTSIRALRKILGPKMLLKKQSRMASPLKEVQK